MIFGDNWRMVTRWNLQNQACLNIFYLRVIATSTGGASTGEIATALDGFFYNNSSLWNPSVATYQGSHFVCVAGIEVGQEFSALANVGEPGVQAPAAGIAAKQLCGLITKRHLMAIPGNRGRMYCGFLVADDVVGGTASVSLQATMQDVADWIANGDTVVGTGGTSTLEFGLVPEGSPSTFKPIKQCTVSPLLATQRRRGDYGRPNP